VEPITARAAKNTEKEGLIVATIIGLTGGIATGKSTVSKMFEEQGVPVIDTDLIAKKQLQKGKPAYKEILALCGEDILAPNGDINRNKLAKTIFSDKTIRQKVNAIVHPKVKKIVKTEIKHFEDLDEPFVLLVVPLLFETDFYKLVDISVLVYARKKDQVERLIARENIDEAYAKQKIKAQLPLSKKREMADYVIDNSKNIMETRKSFQRVFKKIQHSVE